VSRDDHAKEQEQEEQEQEHERKGQKQGTIAEHTKEEK
jgi:hypothetical protein